MVRYPRWLMLALAVVLTGALFTQVSSADRSAPAALISQVAPDGLALGLMASTGAATTTLAATPTPDAVIYPTAAPETTASPADNAALAEPVAEAAAPGDPAAALIPADPPPAEPPAPVEEPTEPPAPEPKGKLIFLDPGHGAPDSGAPHIGPGGAPDLLEKDVNLDVALRLADLLRRDGYDVQLSRETDSFVIPTASTPVELQQRIDMANAAGADLYVSIHHNGSVNGGLSGTEVYYCAHRDYADSNLRLAQLIHNGILNNLRAAGHDAVDRGVKDEAFLGHLAVLAPYNMARATQMPAALGEALFMSNDADAAALARPEIRQAEAQGYFEGIKAYFEG